MITFQDKTLDSQKTIIINACEKAIITCEKIFKDDDFFQNITISIVDNKDYCIPEDHTGGYTESSEKINLYIDPENINSDAIFSMMCHELTHAKRFKDFPDYDDRLIASLIFEGIAIAFENEITKYKKQTFFISEMNSRTNSKNIFEKFFKEFMTNKFDFQNNYFKYFITGDNNIPRWAGYEVGYYIVKKYLIENNLSITDILFTNVDEIKKAMS